MRVRRRGFALLAALWVTVALAAMAFTGLVVAREVVTATQNRVAFARGRWRAEGCLERSRAVIDDVMNGRIAGGWESLDRVLGASPAIADAACDIALVPANVAVDINVADGEQLLALLRATGIGEPRVDSMVDALLDWRDADDIPRPLGAERDWYRARSRFTPRNGPFADVGELRRVRGFDKATLPDSILHQVFTVEPGRIEWSRASLTVLASLPGVGEEALARLMERRSRGIPVTDIDALAADLSPGARQVLVARYADLRRLTTDRPEAWLLTARAGGATIEVRLASAGTRAAIVRRRTTP
jgi:general secretion pathway protein K